MIKVNDNYIIVPTTMSYIPYRLGKSVRTNKETNEKEEVETTTRLGYFDSIVSCLKVIAKDDIKQQVTDIDVTIPETIKIMKDTIKKYTDLVDTLEVEIKKVEVDEEDNLVDEVDEGEIW